jgi:hypothetical protein
MKIAVSIVSHQHGEMVFLLLCRLAACSHVREVLLTLNVPEPVLARKVTEVAWPFALRVLENNEPQGFAFNHNHAFQCSSGSYFAVLNPDVSWIQDPFPDMLVALGASESIGFVYPLQSDSAQHTPVDKARPTPTLLNLLRRHLIAKNSDCGSSNLRTWVNASFLLFKREVFARVGGFDIRYRMYCEDVDMGLRLRCAGYFLCCVQTSSVIHPGNYASRKNLKHLSWHVVSLIRLWWTWRNRPIGSRD